LRRIIRDQAKASRSAPAQDFIDGGIGMPSQQ
jgi:hypothetical protein